MSHGGLAWKHKQILNPHALRWEDLAVKYAFSNLHHIWLLCRRSCCVQTADLVDKEFTILQNGQVAAQQKPRLPGRLPSAAPRQASRSVRYAFI